MSFRRHIAVSVIGLLLSGGAVAGVLGVTAGVVGTLQATEVIKEILDIGQSLTGRMIMYDGLATSFYELKLPWNPNNPLTGTATQD